MSILVLADEYPTARKAHRCQCCGRTVEPGERYHRQRNIGDDGPYVWKSCTHCAEMAVICDLWAWADDYGIGWDSYDQFEPSNLAELRLKALWRKDWRRKDGTLYPVPATSEGGQWGGDAEMVAFLRDAHRRFAALADKTTTEETEGAN